MTAAGGNAAGGGGRPVVERAARGQLWLALGVLVAGLAATALWAGYAGRAGHRRDVERFRAAAERRFQRVLGEVRLTVEVLDSLRLVPQVDGETAVFEAIVRKGMVYQRRVLGAYGFVQVLPAAYRARLEKEGRTFTEAGEGGEFVAAGTRPVYCPLTWQTPPGGLGVPLDYDFGARPEERRAMADMAKDGVFALGGEAFGTADGTRYLMAPLYLSPLDFPRREPEGYAVGLFQPAAILARTEEDGGGELRAGLRPAAEGEGVEEGGGGEWRVEKRFAVANEDWIFTAEPAGGGGGAWALQPAATAAGLGGGLTLLLAAALLDLARRSRRIEGLVAERTRELAETNSRLRDVMAERLSLEDRLLRLADREKARLGRDLHDSLGQKLTGALYMVSAYRRLAEEAMPSLEEEGETISGVLKESLGQVRRMAKGLAPIELTADGLPDALKGLAEESARMLGVEVECEVADGAPAPAPGVAEQLFLIAQEAVVNAAKHSGGKRVRVGLAAGTAGEGVLWVDDDGRGLPADGKSADAEGGNGLRIMRHRAEVFGGRVSFSRGGRGGLKVECAFPAGK